MGKRGKKNSRQSRQNARTRKKAVATALSQHTEAPAAKPIESSRSSPEGWKLAYIALAFGSALTIASLIKDADETIWVFDAFVDGYRIFCASIWRSIAALLPVWLRPFDAQPTYDALTLFALIAGSMIGIRRISDRDRLLDGFAFSLLFGFYQFHNIRALGASAYDVVANTASDLVALILCVGGSVWLEFESRLDRDRKTRWQFVLASFAAATVLISVVADSRWLLFGVIAGDLPADLIGELNGLRHTALTAAVLTLGAAVLLIFYVMRGPRRPVLFIATIIGAAMYGLALSSGAIETALKDAGWWQDERQTTDQSIQLPR